MGLSHVDVDGGEQRLHGLRGPWLHARARLRQQLEALGVAVTEALALEQVPAWGCASALLSMFEPAFFY